MWILYMKKVTGIIQKLKHFVTKVLLLSICNNLDSRFIYSRLTKHLMHVMYNMVEQSHKVYVYSYENSLVEIL